MSGPQAFPSPDLGPARGPGCDRTGDAPWATALRVAALLATDPHGLGGVVVRAGAGPVRDSWLDALRSALGGRPWRRLPPGTGDARLIGGLDLPATLAAGRAVSARGLLAEADGGVVVVPMAERLDPGTAARLAAVLDTGTVALERDGLAARHPARIGLVLLDEGGPDEAVPDTLADRLAFRIALDGIGLGDLGEGRAALAPSMDLGPARDPLPPPSAGEGGPSLSRGQERGATVQSEAEAFMPAPPLPDAGFPSPDPLRGPPSPAEGGGLEFGSTVGGLGVEGRASAHEEHLPRPDPAADPVAALCTAAAALGIASPRAPLLALRVGRAITGAHSSTPPGYASVPEPGEAALTEAARLVLAHRATSLPAPEAPPQDGPDDAPEPDSAETPEPPEDPGHAPEPPGDVVLAAVRAAIPPDLLARLEAGAPVSGPRAGRFGPAKADPRGGRPAGARPGDPRRGRLDLVATLRAAVPWQRLRQGSQPGLRPIRIRAEDLRIRRLVRAPETTTIFCVDASGSAARERLAEAKGAVELMLGEAYARRDRVALVAFRGAGAALVLPPTRALARARRDLAGLPGGGGTPLAAGLDAAGALAAQIRRGGGRPVLVVLTDGRANVARSGAGGRALAGAEAESAARALRGLGVPVLVLDTGARGEGARALARAAGALYRALPQADPETLRDAARTLRP
ncbi:VWA domain-containing protein [Methylobacterium symbioticum]|uniref:VWA domain-containing protein n=1 Tax=uncultured Methylobacterium sp. TaxID=157278 RepID=UPI0025951F53|nr:VWA domain-containing protein [uncultured Methylobacterium sp.]